MAQQRLDVGSLTTHRFAIDDALKAYELVQKGGELYVGIVLTYQTDREQPAQVTLETAARPAPARPT